VYRPFRALWQTVIRPSTSFLCHLSNSVRRVLHSYPLPQIIGIYTSREMPDRGAFLPFLLTQEGGEGRGEEARFVEIPLFQALSRQVTWRARRFFLSAFRVPVANPTDELNLQSEGGNAKKGLGSHHTWSSSDKVVSSDKVEPNR
jgi:hypothetical protein